MGNNLLGAYNTFTCFKELQGPSGCHKVLTNFFLPSSLCLGFQFLGQLLIVTENPDHSWHKNDLMVRKKKGTPGRDILRWALCFSFFNQGITSATRAQSLFSIKRINKLLDPSWCLDWRKNWNHTLCHVPELWCPPGVGVRGRGVSVNRRSTGTRYSAGLIKAVSLLLPVDRKETIDLTFVKEKVRENMWGQQSFVLCFKKLAPAWVFSLFLNKYYNSMKINRPKIFFLFLSFHSLAWLFSGIITVLIKDQNNWAKILSFTIYSLTVNFGPLYLYLLLKNCSKTSECRVFLNQQ